MTRHRRRRSVSRHEREDRRRHATAATGYDAAVRADTEFSEAGAQRLRRPHGLCQGEQVGERQAFCPWNVSGSETLARFRHVAGVAGGGSGVEHDLGLGAQILSHVTQAAQAVGAEMRGEDRLRGRFWFPRCGRSTLRDPFWQPAVEHRHVVVPKQTEQPPAACGGKHAFLVVKNDLAGV